METEDYKESIKRYIKEDKKLWRFVRQFNKDEELKKTLKHYYWLYSQDERNKVVKCYTEVEAENKALNSKRKVERIRGAYV